MAKISVDSHYVYKLCMIMCIGIAPWTTVFKMLSENGFYSTLKWFLLNFFRKIDAKIQISKFLRASSFEI